MGLFDSYCCSNPECEVGIVIPKECKRCPKCGWEIKKFSWSETNKLLKQKIKATGIEKLKIVKAKFVDEFTCLNCNHKWIEEPESVAEKLDKISDELAKFGNSILMPWSRPMWRKEQKRRCPNCGSTVFKKEQKKLFVIE